jgi:nicotinamide-nucleotide amidase
MKVLAEKVGAALKLHGLLLATAESCTGGGVAQTITGVAGSSAWFERGFVTYSNVAKVEMLGVSQLTLDRHGAVSEATVREMAEGALLQSKAQVSLAVSGIAGPDGGTEDKPVGTVWLAWAIKQGVTRSECHHFNGNRGEVRSHAVRAALQGLLILLARRTEMV